MRSTAFDLCPPPRRRKLRPCKFAGGRAFPSFPERPTSRKLGKRFGERSVTRRSVSAASAPPHPSSSSRPPQPEDSFRPGAYPERRRPAAAVRRAHKRERERERALFLSFMGHFFPRLDTPTRSHQIPRWCAVKIGPDASWEIVSKRHTHAVPGGSVCTLDLKNGK